MSALDEFQVDANEEKPETGQYLQISNVGALFQTVATEKNPHMVQRFELTKNVFLLSYSLKFKDLLEGFVQSGTSANSFWKTGVLCFLKYTQNFYSCENILLR